MLVAVGMVGGLVMVPAQPANAYYLFLEWMGLSHSDGELEWAALLEAGLVPFSAAGDPLKECIQRRPVKLQRRTASGSWKTVDKAKSNLKGKVRATAPDRKGSYRMLAPRFTSESGYDCYKGVSKVKRHRH
jgi:hypothetical protein